MAVIDKVKEALRTYNVTDLHETVHEDYNGFEVYCNYKSKHLHIEAVERLALTGMYEVSVGTISSFNVEEGKVSEVRTNVYNCGVRSILRTVTVALEELFN